MSHRLWSHVLITIINKVFIKAVMLISWFHAFVGDTENRRRVTYPWGQLHYGGWQWWHCWCHSRSLQQNWLAPPQNPQAHSWTYSMITSHMRNQSSPVSSQGFRTRFSLSITNLKTSLTWLSSSGPIPSPGMRVTVCRPPYFAGGGCNVILTTFIAILSNTTGNVSASHKHDILFLTSYFFGCTT